MIWQRFNLLTAPAKSECRGGSVTLEAAISVTLMLLIGLTLILVARFLYVSEAVDQAIFEITDQAQYTFFLGMGDRAEGVALKLRLEPVFKRHLQEKGIAPECSHLSAEKTDDGGWQLRAFCQQDTPLLGRLIMERNFHILTAGFVLGQTPTEEVFVTEDGGRYHEAGCHTLRKSKTVQCVKISVAVERGYTPCKICIGNTLFGKPYDK